MAYSHLLVAVAPVPESRQLLEKAVAIARPLQGKITLMTLTTDPELYNQMAAPMMEDLREVMAEETRLFLDDLLQDCDYPIEAPVIVSGKLAAHIVDLCARRQIDLVICGNHNDTFFSKALCSAKKVIATSDVDVLLVALH